MSVAKLTDKMWLVRVDATHFFLDLYNGQVTVTDIPSIAVHYDYYDADRACQALVRRGHRSAVVTDHAGTVVTRDRLVAAQSHAAADAQDADLKFRDEVKTMPTQEVKRRYKADSQFRTRYDALIR